MAAIPMRILSSTPSVGVAPPVASPSVEALLGRTALSIACPLAAINASTSNPLTTIIQRGVADANQRGAADAKAILALTPETRSLLTIIRRFPATDALYQKAAGTPSLSKENQKRTGACTFLFTPFAHSCGAEACGKEREIRIDLARGRTLFPDLGGSFAFFAAIFELTNATSFPAFEKLRGDLRANRITADEYAEAKKRIEHRGALQHHKIMEEGIAKYEWDGSLDVYAGTEPDFKKYWKETKCNPHTELYRTDVKQFVRARVVRVMKDAGMRQEKIDAILKLPYEVLEKMHLNRNDEELRILLNRHATTLLPSR